MDFARDDTGATVTIDMVRGLPVVPELWCAGELADGSECGQPVWATSLQSRVRAAAFAAHHTTGCDQSSEPSVSHPGDAGHAHSVGYRPTRWRLRFDGDPMAQGIDSRSRPDATSAGRTTRRYEVDADLGESDIATERSFSTLLANLIHDSIPPRLELQLGTMNPVMASDMIVHAPEAARATHQDRALILWGKVITTRETPYRGHMLRLEDAADNVAILVDAHQLRRLRITSIDDLVGRHVVAYGRYIAPTTGARLPYLKIEANALAFNPRVRRA